jgi:hypothetical protein
MRRIGGITTISIVVRMITWWHMAMIITIIFRIVVWKAKIGRV